MKYIPETLITVPNTETIDTPYLGCFADLGFKKTPWMRLTAALFDYGLPDQKHLRPRLLFVF